MTKRKEVIGSVVLFVVFMVIILGISYATFNYSKTGEKLNSITTGVVSMSYEESSNIIHLDKALPTTDMFTGSSVSAVTVA